MDFDKTEVMSLIPLIRSGWKSRVDCQLAMSVLALIQGFTYMLLFPTLSLNCVCLCDVNVNVSIRSVCWTHLGVREG